MATVEPNTRGSWNLDAAIAYQWYDVNLDRSFRDEWPEDSRQSTEYHPLNDGMAHPMPPGPYCVYEKSPPVVVAHMTSHVVDQQHQLQSCLVQFKIHAKSTTTMSGKELAKKLAEKVAKGFDPNTHPWLWTDDRPVIVLREPDFHTREGADEWMWVLQYRIVFDAQYQI